LRILILILDMLSSSNTHEMNFTTKQESDVTGIRRSIAKRPRRLWIGVLQARLPVVSTLLRIPFILNSTGLSYKQNKTL